ncbi:MAG: mechanosensitive ion channel family protein, partial [Gemmatimonadetes bacterium]|nr:mechanosensitive ion channel family protein [Gemmatimonadota bacterium]
MEILGFDLGAIDIQGWWRAFVEYAAPRWGPSFGVLILAGLAYLIGRPILWRIEKRWVTRTVTKLDDYAVRLLRKAFLLSTLAWAAWRLLTVWGLPTVAQWALAIWIALLFVPLSRFVGDVLSVLETQIVQRTQTTLDDTALPLLNTVIRFLIVALGVMLALDRLGLNIAPLLAGAGVMGLALSLAAKDTLSNL